MSPIYNVLSIAGNDPSGGAGIQADLKTFSALNVYGCTVLTSLVAQNTLGVQAIYPVSADCVAAQLDSVLSDICIYSVKIGMLSQSSIIRVIANKLIEYPIPWLVLDPVMVAKSGDKLLNDEAVITLREMLLPLVSIITPNLLEAGVLLGCAPAKNEDQMCKQGHQLLELGCQAVVIKGGHLLGESSPDWFVTHDEELCFNSPRIVIKHTHGTGCALSAALAALRPRFDNWSQTLHVAKAWLQQALIHANNLSVGHGIGPIHHFHKWW